MAWQGVKLSRLISIFTSNNVWKFLIKIHLTKSNPKNIREVNPSSLLPIRVKIPAGYRLATANCVHFTFGKVNYNPEIYI